jgi:hypothetical protein
MQPEYLGEFYLQHCKGLLQSVTCHDSDLYEFRVRRWWEAERRLMGERRGDKT